MFHPTQLRYFSKDMPMYKLDVLKLPASTENIAIFQLKGKLSLETVNEFLPASRAETAKNVVLDMSEVNFLDSAGIGSLVSLFVSRRNQGKTFSLAALGPQAQAVVTVAGLQNLLSIYKTVDEAVAKLT
jgi:anti-sigma B factor antagonist